MAKFKLKEIVPLIYQGKVVHSKISKRIKVENLDSNKSEIYYDYIHHLDDGSYYTFYQVSEDTVLHKRKLALDKINQSLNKSQ